MNIHEMFQKPIDRDIKGVIKVGQADETNVLQELDEYVVTNELNNHFQAFFDSYKKGIEHQTDKMGVWISGFFGSGKSHFLKILSYLLANREVHGKHAVSFFEDKITDPMILANMKQVTNVTTDTILFNIDAKSDSDSKLHKDSILKVFNKVFNEMQGFCGSIPWVADLERHLVKDEVYESFKAEFERISGTSWIEAREDFYYEEDAIVEALSKTTKMSEDAAKSWYNKAEDHFSLSIEKFAQKVNEYIESKGTNHHVLFLVDEIGQYIGDDTQLMLNLQTVVEQLGIYCGGKCWVLVTSQQEIDAVTKVKGDDFSKIQGRFNTRISLSSANVDEVIRKRILQKNETATQSLQLLYPSKRSIINNLITFKDTPEMKSYKTEDDFVSVYPFIPYQFGLLQKVFTGVRIHGAAGKHLAEGERSLLSAFQESAIQYASEDIGFLVPFSSFYETIESFLDASIRSVIIQAKQNSHLDEADIEVLKLLFLVKYVKEMPANIENLATLMVRNIDEDKVDRMKQIETSLGKLIRETLIQKNGEEYIFLTNDEQDVNREIKSIQIDMNDVIREIGVTIFEDIYDEKKFRYSSRYHFPFNAYIDELALRQQTHQFGVKIISPYYDGVAEATEAELKLMSMRESNIIVKLSSELAAIEEMEQAKKIDSYLRKVGVSSTSSAVDEIKMRKRRESSERKARVRTLLVEGLKEAQVFVNNQLLSIKAKNPEERLNDAFKTLVESLFNKLNYIKEHTESVKDLYEIQADTNIQLSLLEEDVNKLAIDEMNHYIKRQSQRNIPMTMKSMLNHFTNPPFGWLELDIQACIIKLFKSQEIKLQLNQQYVRSEDTDLINYLSKRDYVERLIIRERQKTPLKYIQNAKELSKEIFKVSSLPNDEDGLKERFNHYCERELSTVIEKLLYNFEHQPLYPGKSVLHEAKQLFNELLQVRDTSEWYQMVYKQKEELLDYGEDIQDIKHFFEKQQQIFDNAVEKVTLFEKNRTYVIDEEVVQTVDQIKKVVYQENPYRTIHLLPNLIETFNQKFSELLEKECEPVRQVIQNDYQKVLDELGQYPFKDQFLPKIKQRFEELLDRLERVNNFFEAIAMKEESDRLKLRSFNEINQFRVRFNQTQENSSPDKGNERESVQVTPNPTQKRTVNLSLSNIMRGATSVESEEDIEKLVQQVRERLKQELTDDIVIRLI